MSAPLHPFARAARDFVAKALDMAPESFVVGEPPKANMGDLAVGCFPAAKIHKKSPAQIASGVAERFEPQEGLASAQAAGPFVNFRIDKSALFEHLHAVTLGDEELVPKTPGEGKSICIDFSSPNISKQLAYHHIRSTVIGHALCNLYRAAGYRVIGINHLGDWGTTHGMLIAAYKKWPPEDEATLDIQKLNDLYVQFREAMKEDPSLEDEGRAWFARLEGGDEEARKLWQHFKDISWAEFASVYDGLGIHFDEVKGESAFMEDVPKVLTMLDEAGLSTVSEGALVVPMEDEDSPPLLLRKSDGATLYGTRDLAAAIYRWQSYEFARNLYVVDRGQGLHFSQVFETLSRLGFDWAERCQHVPFGLVRLGGRKTGTRAGNVVLLKEVFAEATERVREKIKENHADWPEGKLADTAETVGVGAVVFANLMSAREKDVDFDWDQILSTSGDSGAYVQYGHARCCRTLEKGIKLGQTTPNYELLTQELEWSLARALGNYADTVARAADSNDPHILSRYLLDLVGRFSGWYTAGNQDKSLRVLCDDEDLQRARLHLCAMTKTVLADGLGLLGVGAPQAM